MPNSSPVDFASPRWHSTGSPVRRGDPYRSEPRFYADPASQNPSNSCLSPTRKHCSNFFARFYSFSEHEELVSLSKLNFMVKRELNFPHPSEQASISSIYVRQKIRDYESARAKLNLFLPILEQGYKSLKAKAKSGVEPLQNLRSEYELESLIQGIYQGQVTTLPEDITKAELQYIAETVERHIQSSLDPYQAKPRPVLQAPKAEAKSSRAEPKSQKAEPQAKKPELQDGEVRVLSKEETAAIQNSRVVLESPAIFTEALIPKATQEHIERVFPKMKAQRDLLHTHDGLKKYNEELVARANGEIKEIKLQVELGNLDPTSNNAKTRVREIMELNNRLKDVQPLHS